VLDLPEAGLPSLVVLHGFMGVQPTGGTLRIAPRLPATVESLGVRGLHFQGRGYDLEVRRDKAILLRAGPGRPATVRLQIDHLPPNAKCRIEDGHGTAHPRISGTRADASGRLSFTWPAEEGGALLIEPQ
jgi:hypothetical protein